MPDWLFAVLMILAGVLAIVLPPEVNPFRLKRRYRAGVSSDFDRKLPRRIGWVLIVFGAFGLLMSLLPERRDAADLAVEAGTAATGRRP